MRRWLGAVGLSAALAGVAVAQTAQTPIRHYTTLFISPCGEPWRGGPGEPYPVVAWFNSADTNHDGALDIEEFQADAAIFFDVLDRDKNGYIDGSEVAFYETRIAPEVLTDERIGYFPDDAPALILIQSRPQEEGIPGTEGPKGPVGMGRLQRQVARPEGAARFGLLNESEPVASTDTDLNGKITLTEFLAAADRRFKRLDKNGDGKLTLAELPKPDAQLAFEDSERRRKR